MNGLSSTAKTIRWENGQWVGDPVTIRVRRSQDGGLADVDGADISLRDEKGWLTFGRATQAADKSWVVSVSVLQGAVIGPPGQASGSAEYSVGEVTGPKPPQQQIEDLVTVTVKVKATGMAEAVTAAGMFPGAGSVLPGAIPPITLTQEVRYQVQPPRVVWSVEQEDPVLLSGKQILCPIVLSAQLPPGWLQSAKVTFAISDKSKNLGLALAVERKEAPPNGLAAQVKLSSAKLVMHPVGELVHNKGVVNASIDLVVTTQSPHLGTDVQTRSVDAQALDVCVYFKDSPASSYEWNERTIVGVLPSEQADRPPPRRCKLPVSLRHLKDWSPPSVHWELADALKLDDVFSEPALPDSDYEYISPGKKRWEEEGRPAAREILCRVGEGEGNLSVDVPQHLQEDLYHYLAPALKIEIGERLAEVRLLVRLRPRNLPKTASDLELVNPDVWQSLERVITLDIKL